MFNMEGSSTKDLLKLCFGYFFFYVITGLTVKYFIGHGPGLPGMNGLEFLVYSTAGGQFIALGVVLLFKWYRLQSNRLVSFLGMKVPIELFYIIPSGICTAVIIPTTTLMYSLPISVMVAMVMMRGSVIIISRIVDALQVWQGILHKKVYWEENVAVLFAIIAVSVHLTKAGSGGFDFLHNTMAMVVFCSYIVAYAIRIYIMNYFKNTRGKGVKQDNKGYFAFEQFTAAFVILVTAIIVFNSPKLFGLDMSNLPSQIFHFRKAFLEPMSVWPWAILAGMAFGAVSFFSVFIFMYKGRTATFAGLTNRLTSLIAGTTATLLFWLFFHGKFPSITDWLSLGFIVIALIFIARAERKRVAELAITA